MLDIKFIRDNVDKVKKAIADKRIDLDLDQFLDVDERRRSLMAETESLQATKNAASKELPNLSVEDKKVKILELKEVDSKQAELKETLRQVEAEFEQLMLLVPNIPSPESPVGPDESANTAWSYWSPELGHVDPKDKDKVAEVPKKIAFEIKDHITLGKELDLIDIERGVNTSGFRGYYLKNEAVLMQYGLFWHTLEKLQQKGFTLMAPPVLVREFALKGSGHFPAGRAEVYQVGNAAHLEDADKEPTFLAGTSEPSLLAYYADQILEEKDLPIKLCGISPCFRSEVGSYGKDARGVYRVHEFMKVEQVIITKADMLEGDKWLETLREIGEELLQELKLPYRVLNIATGDMGAGKYKMYDIETWMPARGSYGETHSDSNLTDWQARRLNIRYRGSDGKVHFAYTLNNTAAASPRLLIPILENYQQSDGSVVVPEILRKYVGKDVIQKKG
jgi:seryl-tRNA synthetase